MQNSFKLKPSDISLIIPTLNAGWDLPGLLERIERQTLQPNEILIIDSSSDDDTVEVARAHGGSGVRVKVISRNDFNHGLTRHKALLETSGQFVCFMTQDAVPADAYYFENLLSPFADPEIALVSGRQLPKPDARRFEQLIRNFNYGPDSSVRTIADVPRIGIKAYFASDVCSAYRRTSYMQVGGFAKLDISEDMYMAMQLINSGYKVAYAADACVYHSHNLTPLEQYKRNKAIAEFIETNRSNLKCTDELWEGSRLLNAITRQLIREGELKELTVFYLDCVSRFLGNCAGRGSVRRKKAKA